MDEQVLHQVVANGEPGTHAPLCHQCRRSLTDQQVDALVNGMRAAWFKAGLCRRQPAPIRPPRQRMPRVASRSYTTYCASCHGAAGQAGKSKAGSITDPRSWRWSVTRSCARS